MMPQILPTTLENSIRTSASTDMDLAHHCIRISKMLCFLVPVFLLTVGIGWILEIPFLRQGHLSLPMMRPNTAVFLILASVAIFLNQKQPKIFWRTTLSRVLSVFIFIFGLLVFSEYVLAIAISFNPNRASLCIDYGHQFDTGFDLLYF